MALDKLVDSAQLDANLTSVANAIRTKGGTSANLTFPQGFVDAVDAIQTGGGGSDLTEKFVTGVFSGDAFEFPYTTVGRCFSNTTGAFTLKMPNVTKIQRAYQFEGSSVTSLFIPNCILAKDYIFSACASLETIVYSHSTYWNEFPNCSRLKTVDMIKSIGQINNSFQGGCVKLDTLILRGSTIVPLANLNAFASTKFKNGGAGGTIYIPKALYDHLGDGSSLDYKAATNWSTLDGYGTITWAAIEGSIYETQYADGTPIT